MSETTKVCSRCKLEKPLRDFYKNRAKQDGYTCHCKPCHLLFVKTWRRANPEKARKSQAMTQRKALYGLTEASFQGLKDAQGGACAICRRGATLVVDHCHATGKVRGLLCNNCNVALGLLKESPGTLKAALEYLGRGSE